MTPIAISIDHIPHKPWVYFFKNKKEEILYIGKAKDLKKRVWQYFSPGSVWKQDMVAKAHQVDFVNVNNESEALYLEDNLIKKHKPPYNSLLKGDNSYVFIKITNEAFPQVLLTRKRRKDGAIYIGPKRWTKQLKKVLQHTRMLFQYRGCKNTQFREWKLCSDYFFWLCKWRCVFAKLKDLSTFKNQTLIEEGQKLGLKVEKNYEAYQNESQDVMKYMATLFDGNPAPMLEMVYKQIQTCIETQNFERAWRLKDVYQGLEQFRERQNVVLDVSITGRMFKLIKIQDRYVYCLIHLQEWRLIDVVRHKLSAADSSINEIISLFESEYGDIDMLTYTGTRYTKVKNRIKTKEWWERETEVMKGEYEKSMEHSQIINYLEKNIETWCLWITKSIKNINEFGKELEVLLDKFLDAYILSSSWEKESVMNDLLSQLKGRYYLKSFPYRIECIDISHLSGGWMSWWLSCLIGGIPYKKNYRRYKIKEAKASDDYGALEEIIIRRFKLSTSELSKQTELPDLFILDGWKAQLNVVEKIKKKSKELQNLCERVQFASLEKGKARSRSSKSTGATEFLHILCDDGNIVTKALSYDKTDQLLTALRDEAHRFANKYRKKQMSKEWK